MNIIEAIRDPNLFQPFLGDLQTWSAWQTALRATYGLPIDPSQSDLIRTCTGRDLSKLPKDGFSTVLFLTGRRSGKSRTSAVLAAYEATLAGREQRLAAGERGVVLITSPTKQQSRVVRDYIRGVFDIPLLRDMIVSDDRTGFELNNGVRIEILAGDWRTVRGYTLLAAIVDEAAFFGYDTDSKVKNDAELIRAIKPSLATSGGKLIAISSPYAEKGWCFNTYRANFANDAGPTLVWNCPSRVMNATLPQEVVDEALLEDPAAARAEYLGQFRNDIVTFLTRDIIEACVIRDRTELLPQPKLKYFGFCDVSGGRNDDAAMAIGHRDPDTQKLVIDYVRRWPAVRS